jgi:MFS-type transporter involved in bile tolerance (Atg22 family)
VALGAIAAGALLLAGSNTVAVAVVAGFGIGAWSPLQGVYAASLFERRTLGMTLGLYAAIGMTFGAIGPLVAGPITDATADPRIAAIIAAITAALGALVMARTRTDRNSAPTGGV